MNTTSPDWMAQRYQAQAWTFPTWAIGQTTSTIARRLPAFNVLLFLSLLLLSHATWAEGETTPTPVTTWIPFKASYTSSLNGNIVDDDGKRELRYLGNKRFRFSAKAESMLFKIEEVSEFQAEGTQILPLQYQSSRSNPFKQRKKAIGFDWENKQLHFQDRKRSGTHPLDGPTLDPLSAELEIARQMKSDNTTIQYKEASGRKIKTRIFTVKGPETLNLPYGKITAIKLEKTDKKDRKTFLWIAPSLNHIAVKVKQTKDSGEIYELELKTYQPLSPVRLTHPQIQTDITVATVEEPPYAPEDIK